MIQTSFLGDMILTTPLLVELARRGPVDVVATPANATLLANHPAVRDVFVYDKRGEGRGASGLWRLARQLRRRHHDVAYLAQGSTRSAVLALASGVRRRVGFSTSAGRWLYTERVDYRHDRHHAERLWSLAMSVGAEPEPASLRPSLVPGAVDEAAAEALLASLAGTTRVERPLVALAPGSAWATKRWPYYPELAAELAARARIVVIGGAGDAPLAQAIRSAAEGAADDVELLDATGKLSLLASAALLRRADLLVTNDSSPLHLASAAGTPTIALFGPTIPGFGFGPLAPDSITMGRTDLSCRPCDAHGPERCPLGHWRCMRELTPPAVAAAVWRILFRTPAT